MFFQSEQERRIVSALTRLNDANPFLPERIQLEREVLGARYKDRGPVWYAQKVREWNPNVEAIRELATTLSDQLRERLIAGARPDTKDWELYRELVYYRLYYQYENHFYDTITKPGVSHTRVDYFKPFLQDLSYFLETPPISGEVLEAEHLFSFFFQVRRAFHFIFDYIIGSSLPVAEFRAAVWQSIFTHDMKRYQRSLYRRMGDMATIITGRSGTGKDLVAEAIGRSRYIEFDKERSSFILDFNLTFFPIHLPALSPTLIESELFGHCRGSFTGAHADHKGYLEVCPPLGSVFLDEIGEVTSDVQVKLLRVLQNRTFQRLGEAVPRSFNGKIIAATNRNLAAEIEAGRFREDFFFRLCSDQITTPSLSERLADDYGELERLVNFLTKRIAGEEEAAALSNEVLIWINKNLSRSYPWPGNVRELEQCVRNVLIRGVYRPNRSEGTDRFERNLLKHKPTAEQLLNQYCMLIYQRCGSYQETARLLDLDRRTVKARIQAFQDQEEMRDRDTRS